MSAVSSTWARADTNGWTSGGNAWDANSRQGIGGANITIAGQTAPGPVIFMGGTLKPSGSNIVIRNITIAAGYGMKGFWEPPPKSPPVYPALPTSYTMDAIDVSGQNIMLDHLDALYCSDEAISCNEKANHLTVRSLQQLASAELPGPRLWPPASARHRLQAQLPA